MKKYESDMTADELLDVCGPNWGAMTDEERIAYGPRRTLRGRASRTRALIAGLAEEWGYWLVDVA